MFHHARLCLLALALTLAACGKPTTDQTEHTIFGSPIAVGSPIPSPTLATHAEIHEEWPRDLSQPGWHPSYPDRPTPTEYRDNRPEQERETSRTSFASPTSTPTPAAPSIVLPPPPELTIAGRQLLLSSGGRALVLEFETGGKEGYDPHPEWPGGASGVTVGIGYDCGYYSPKVILSDWAGLIPSDRTRLAGTSGITGQRARAKKNEVRDIFVQWAIATDVFDRVDVAREFASAKRAIPGFVDLRQNAQAAWLSLGFNRGWQMSGPNRVEMRTARDLAPVRDYEGMAIQFRKMKRVWTGTKIQAGMYRRRDAEAKLLLTP